jgi:hypothetical protein
MIEKRTPRAWSEYLSAEHQDVTLTEYMAACLARILGCLVESTQATAHVEGMLGAIDEMCSRLDAEYKRDGEVRAALDRQRDSCRAMAAAERNGGGREHE